MQRPSVTPAKAISDWVTESTDLLDSLPDIAGQAAAITNIHHTYCQSINLARSTVMREAIVLGETVLGQTLSAFDEAEHLIELCCVQWGKGAIELHTSQGPGPFTLTTQSRRAIERVSRLANFFEKDTEQPFLHLDRLSDQEFKIWQLLKDQALTGKDIAFHLPERPNHQTVAKRIQRMRKKGFEILNQREGTRGYYRPDAPPLSLS